MAVIENTGRVAQLTGMIADEEKKIEKLYSELGKAYFELRKDEETDEFKVQITGIKDSMKKIEDYNKTIKEVKGLVPCPKCGKDMKKTDAFCTSCGYRVAPAEEPKPVVSSTASKCTNCGAVVPNGSMFCTSCGTKITQSAPAIQATENAQPKCTNCGAVVPSGSLFCTSCGTKITQPATVQTPAEKPIPKCTSCGAVVPSGSLFCTACGTKVVAEVPKAEVPATPKCTNCGAALTEGSLFCTACGTKVEAPKAEAVKPVVEATVAVEAPKPAAPVAAEAPVAPKRFCINCGKEIATGAKFCIYCGGKQ